jgi:hypothetical protein
MARVESALMCNAELHMVVRGKIHHRKSRVAQYRPSQRRAIVYEERCPQSSRSTPDYLKICRVQRFGVHSRDCIVVVFCWGRVCEECGEELLQVICHSGKRKNRLMMAARSKFNKKTRLKRVFLYHKRLDVST